MSALLSMDHVLTEHVRCGHQMHQECFQSYHDSLVRRHCGQTTYEGKSIELHRTEFLCPICRRLANLLLPVVHQGRFSRVLQACDLDNQRDYWEKFWKKRKNLPGALEQLAVQSLNMGSNFLKEPDVKECHQLLWNVLNYVCALVAKDSTATPCESLGVTALQMLALALQDRRIRLARQLDAWKVNWVSATLLRR